MILSSVPSVEAARDYGLIISIHSGPNNCHPNRIGTVASWVPETPVIMDHMGFPDDLDAGISVAKENKNVSLGTTILRFHRRWGTDPGHRCFPTEVKKAVDETRARTDRLRLQFARIPSYSGD